MKYGRHGKSGDEWRLVPPSGNVANIPLLLLLLCSASLIIIGLRSSSPFDSTLSVSSVSTSPPSSPRLLFLLLIFPSAKIFFHFIPSSRFRDLAFRGEKKIWPKESFSKTKRFQLLDKGYPRSCVRTAWKFHRKEERCGFSIFYTSSRLELVEQFALISEQCAHRKLYPTMRTLYPRLFWCRLRVRGVNNSFRCSPHACPYYYAIISKGPKLNPAFQPPFSLSPLIFLRIFVFLPPGREKRSKKRRNGRREVEIFARICVTLAFRFFF